MTATTTSPDPVFSDKYSAPTPTQFINAEENGYCVGGDPRIDPSVGVCGPFPADTLPTPVRRYVLECAGALKCRTALVGLPLLAVLAAAIGNSRRLQLKRSWLVPPILWTAIVSDSGTKKSPALDHATRHTLRMESESAEDAKRMQTEYAADLARHEKDLRQWQHDKTTTTDPPAKPDPPTHTRHIVSDTTVEALAMVLEDNPRGVLLGCDELSAWLGSFDRYAAGGQGSDVSHWLSMYNGKPMVVDRKTGGRRTLHVPSAAVSVAGGIQPAILARALGVENVENGLLSRLLLTHADADGKLWDESDVSRQTDGAMGRVLANLYSLPADNGPVVVALTAEAKAAWVSHYNAHSSEMIDTVGRERSLWAKAEELPARLALILHCAEIAAGNTDIDPLAVDQATMANAVTLAGWLVQETLRVYSLLDETDDDRERRRLVEWIRHRGGSVTVRDLQRHLRRYATAESATAALCGLVTAKLGEWRSDTHHNGPGRPVSRFHLYPPTQTP